MDLTFYGQNYGQCTSCYRMSMPVSRTACWIAMKVVRDKAGNAQTWSPLDESMSLLLEAPPALVHEVRLPDLTHAQALALRSLTLCGHDVMRAIASLRTWAAEACEEDQPR